MERSKGYVKRLIFISVIIAVGQVLPAQTTYSKADTLRGALTPLRTCYDVLCYDLDIKVDVENQHISGSNTITFKVESNTAEVQIDLFENLRIQKIEYKGTLLKYNRLFNAVFIKFPHELKRGDTTSIQVHYAGKPVVARKPPWDGGFSWTKDSLGNDWVGVSCQHLGASSWWPCKDHQSDEPDEMYIRVAVPSHLMAVCNGQLVNSISLPDSTIKYEWYVSYPINNYAVTLNIAKYKLFTDSYVNPHCKDTLALSYYVLPYNYEKAQIHFAQVKPMLDCYYRIFGKYPFLRDGYKLVETPYLGMEHQSCIAYGNKYMNGYLGRDLSGAGYLFDYIIIHESAHEWWGNAVTANDIADMWVHEGFATYTEALYVECMHGYEAYLKYINGLKRKVKNDIPIIADYGVNKMGSTDMYAKGALLLHTLRSIVNNDSSFYGMLYEIQNRYQYKTVNTAELEQFISEIAVYDFSLLFDVYLRNASIPVFEYSIRKKRKGSVLSFRYDVDKLWSMPLKVTLQQGKYEFIYPTNKWQSIAIPELSEKEFKVATELFYVDVKEKK